MVAVKISFPLLLHPTPFPELLANLIDNSIMTTIITTFHSPHFNSSIFISWFPFFSPLRLIYFLTWNICGLQFFLKRQSSIFVKVQRYVISFKSPASFLVLAAENKLYNDPVLTGSQNYRQSFQKSNDLFTNLKVAWHRYSAYALRCHVEIVIHFKAGIVSHLSKMLQVI